MTYRRGEKIMDNKKTILSPELFTPEQIEMIDKFLEDNKDLMEDLRKLEELSPPLPPEDSEWIEKSKLDN